jgi:hypothetical protein
MIRRIETRREVRIMVKKRMRGNGEFNVPKTFELHPDAVAAHARMAERFKPSLGAGAKKQLVSFGILLLEKEIAAKGVKPGDDIEAELGIQADQPGNGGRGSQATAKKG